MKFWSISEACQYTDKAGIFESLMSQWATASQAEMGRPECLTFLMATSHAMPP